MCVHLTAFDTVIEYHNRLSPPHHFSRGCVADVSGKDSHKRLRVQEAWVQGWWEHDARQCGSDLRGGSGQDKEL